MGTMPCHQAPQRSSATSVVKGTDAGCNAFAVNDVRRQDMENANTNGKSVTAFSREEISLLRKRLAQNTNGAPFDKTTVARLLATIDTPYDGSASGIKTKHPAAESTLPRLQRELATKEAEVVRLRRALKRISQIITEVSSETGKSKSKGRISWNGVSLAPMQRLVLEEICKGKTTRQIAEGLHRSKHTISNHVKVIFKAFAVRSRSALVAEALHKQLDG
jgi:DNA-binding NarL/FixJ family response regulator